jgi:hypothetical protein
MMRRTSAQLGTLILLFIMGIGVVAIFANIADHILNPSIILIQPSQVTMIVQLELLGMTISLLINKGKPPFRPFGRKRQAHAQM